VINQGLLLAYVLYAANVGLIALIITRLVKEALGSGAPISVNRFITFIAHEVKSIRKSVVGAMHLAILGAVSLSILYTLIYPWVYRSQLAHYVMFGVASPLIVGLIVPLRGGFRSWPGPLGFTGSLTLAVSLGVGRLGFRAF